MRVERTACLPAGRRRVLVGVNTRPGIGHATYILVMWPLAVEMMDTLAMSCNRQVCTYCGENL